MANLGRAALNFAFLFALTLWGGMVFFFTFINTPVVFADLDRDTAARLLGDLFPRYFQVQLICIVVALGALGLRVALRGAPRALAVAGLVALGLSLVIALYANFRCCRRCKKRRCASPRSSPPRRTIPPASPTAACTAVR
ncbi:MAG: DUF4149 domain-containing protein [Chloroflexia bacterium]